MLAASAMEDQIDDYLEHLFSDENEAAWSEMEKNDSIQHTVENEMDSFRSFPTGILDEVVLNSLGGEKLVEKNSDIFDMGSDPCKENIEPSNASTISIDDDKENHHVDVDSMLITVCFLCNKQKPLGEIMDFSGNNDCCCNSVESYMQTQNLSTSVSNWSNYVHTSDTSVPINPEPMVKAAQSNLVENRNVTTTTTATTTNKCFANVSGDSRGNSAFSPQKGILTERQLFSCSSCTKLFPTQHFLDVHLRYYHGVKPFSCSICSEIFSCSMDLRKHMRTHTSGHNSSPENVKPVSVDHRCMQCDKKFTSSSRLSVHVKRHHCTVCNKSFSQLSSLVTHLRIHSGERPYMCWQCSRTFIHASDLSDHMLWHNGMKP